MLKTKMIQMSSVLRIIAVVAILSFSFEIATSYFVADDLQLEIVDVDLEDDVEADDELDSTWNFTLQLALEINDDTHLNGHKTPVQMSSQHLKELPTPPPDCA